MMIIQDWWVVKKIESLIQRNKQEGLNRGGKCGGKTKYDDETDNFEIRNRNGR